MKSGVINIYKEAGCTSFDVVARLRKILGIKKIGHTGTLDPEAVGVLPVCIQKATRLCDMLTDSDKTYEAQLVLGIKTDTGDTTGTVLKTSDVTVTDEEVREAILSFVGDIMQVPPMYSALKVDGKKLVDLARKGISVERTPRPVTIHSIDILSVELPNVVMSVRCSKGTYIRTLCEDIGDKLGCFGTMGSLKRTRAAGLSIDDSFTLGQIAELAAAGKIDECIIPIDKMLSHPAISVKPEYDVFLKNGVVLYKDELSGDFSQGVQYLVYDYKGDFVGVYEGTEDGLKVIKMFYEK